MVSGAFIRHLRRCEQLNVAVFVRSRHGLHSVLRWQEGTMIVGDGSVSIRERTGLGHSCHVSSHWAGAQVVLGRQCAMAHSIHLRTADYARLPGFRGAFELPWQRADVITGHCVRIGSQVHICARVTIGGNSLIRANREVPRDVPPEPLVGGVRARLIHEVSVCAAPSVRG